MDFKDYYKIMGVGEKASTDEIKKAYRKLARKYHPDVSKEPDAEARFKELGEAYEALKDPEKRTAYDNLRKGGWRGGEQFTPPPGWQQQTGRGGFQGNFSEGDAGQFSDFFETLFGRQGSRGGFRQGGRTFKARGEDMAYPLHITLEEAYAGGTRTLQLRVPEADESGRVAEKTRTLNVKIPVGVVSGQQIRLQGQGGPGRGGGANGDLYLEIQIDPHKFFHLEGRNITLSLPITPWEAALGASIEVPTLGGKIAVKIPTGSQTGTKMRLKGRGLPGATPGDQFLLLQIFTPPADSEAVKALYEQMSKTMPFNPRKEWGA